MPQGCLFGEGRRSARRAPVSRAPWLRGQPLPRPARSDSPLAPTPGPLGPPAQPLPGEERLGTRGARGSPCAACEADAQRTTCPGRGAPIFLDRLSWISELSQFRSQGRGLSRCPPGAPGGRRAGPWGGARGLFCLERVSGERLSDRSGKWVPSTRRFWESSPQPFSSQMCECALHPVADKLH